MSAIKLKRGSIYFLKERDYITGKVSPYVKIGLVREDKDTAARIAEHQTGNPREILDYKTMESPFVEHLETQLHYRFSDKWITGEWFKLDENILVEAVEEAEKIISEQYEFEPAIRKSYELAKTECTEEEREPADEEKDLWEKLIEKKLQMDIVSAEKAIIESNIRMALGHSGGIPGVASVQLKKGGTSFNEKPFSEKHPGLFKEFCTKETESLSGSFTLKGKMTLKKAKPEVYERKIAVPDQKVGVTDIDFQKSAKRTKKISGDHAEYIELQKQLYILDWEYSRLEALLKCATGLSRGLAGICGWNRVLKQRVGFDRNAFEESHPLIYEEFMESKADTTAMIINSCRPYHV